MSMELVTSFHPGVFNSLKFIIEYIWFDHFIHWFRGKLKRAANVNEVIRGQAVTIQDVIDPSYSETVQEFYNMFRFRKPKGGSEHNEKTESHISASEKGTSFDAADSEQEETNAAKQTASQESNARTALCRFFSRVLPIGSLICFFLLEYATDTTANCTRKSVPLLSARSSIGVLVSAFTCGLMEQGNTSASVYRVSYTDSFLSGNQIVCGCTTWKNENCLVSYNGSAVEASSKAEWSSSVQHSRQGIVRMLDDIRQQVGAPKHLTWIPLRNEELRDFVRQNGGFLACFSGNGVLANGTRVNACAYKNTRTSSFADVIVVSVTSTGMSLIFYSLPIKNNVPIEPTLKGIVDGPSHIFRGVPVIYCAKSEHLSKVNPMRMTIASLELLVHFNIRYAASSIDEGVILSHAMVLMLSVYSRLQPSGNGVWKECSGYVMSIGTPGTIASLVVIACTVVAFFVAVVASPEKAYDFLMRGRALESNRWAVNSLLSEKFGRSMCMKGENINAEVVLKRSEGNRLHISVVPPGAKCASCEPKEIPNIEGQLATESSVTDKKPC